MDKAKTIDFLKVIIIGAPRSGTNILRDVLTSIDGIHTWPCDEINYIWRHGNVGYPSDEIPADRAHSKVQQYIRKRFQQIASRYEASVVVEKTCANSLRVPFVDKVIPDAKYIYIHRNGLDVAASAKLRWTSSLNIPYIFSKAIYVPTQDIPYYALKYLWSRIYRLFSREKRLAFWGPILDNNIEVLQQHSLIEVCGLQWQRCIESAESAFAKMPKDRVFELSYEDFVDKPAEHLENILEFIGYSASAEDINSAAELVHTDSLGSAGRGLKPAEIDALNSLVGRTLYRHR